jgi:hypothetical protein
MAVADNERISASLGARPYLVGSQHSSFGFNQWMLAFATSPSHNLTAD